MLKKKLKPYSLYDTSCELDNSYKHTKGLKLILSENKIEENGKSMHRKDMENVDTCGLSLKCK